MNLIYNIFLQISFKNHAWHFKHGIYLYQQKDSHQVKYFSCCFISLRLFEKSIQCNSSRMLHNVSQSIRFNILFQFKISEHHNFLSCQVSAWESVISHEIKNRTRPSPPRDLHTIPHWYTTANNLSSFYRACHYFWFWKISAKSYNKQNVPEKVTLNKVSSGILFS